MMSLKCVQAADSPVPWLTAVRTRPLSPRGAPAASSGVHLREARTQQWQPAKQDSATGWQLAAPHAVVVYDDYIHEHICNKDQPMLGPSHVVMCTPLGVPAACPCDHHRRCDAQHCFGQHVDLLSFQLEVGWHTSRCDNVGQPRMASKQGKTWC